LNIAERGTIMIVTIKIEFPTVKDVDSGEANDIVDAITLDTLKTALEWSDYGVHAWVDDVTAN